MKPVSPVAPNCKLEEVTFAKNQPEYTPLPALIIDGYVITRWKLSLLERVLVLFTGSIWLTVLTFGSKLQPVKLETQCPVGDQPTFRAMAIGTLLCGLVVGFAIALSALLNGPR